MTRRAGRNAIDGYVVSVDNLNVISSAQTSVDPLDHNPVVLLTKSSSDRQGLTGVERSAVHVTDVIIETIRWARG